MLKIRLQRTGRKHEATFRLVLTDSKNSTKSGKFLEILGSHDFRKSVKPTFKADRIKHWMSHGVQLTPTIHNLLISEKVITGKKINVLPKKTAPKKEEVVVEAKVAEVKVAEVKSEPVVEAAAVVEEVKVEEAPAA